QHDPFITTQLASHGIGDAEVEWESNDVMGLLGARSAWRLLLQVDSISEIGMDWADGGLLYYSIRDTDLHASLEVLRALPFLLLARHLLDLDPQATERLLQGRHLGHDLPDPAGKLRVGRLIQVRLLCHRHTIIGQRVRGSSVDRPAQGCPRHPDRRTAAGARTDWSRYSRQS
ncbi:MAG: DUF1963 domain-containing protein, partial [Chloroflexi bacterium]